MPNYIRAREGQIYFFTVVTYERQRFLCLKQSRQILREAIRKTRETQPFAIDAWVLLPDHMHCIWTMPVGDHDYSRRWGMIKKEFTKAAGKWLKTPALSSSHLKKRESTVWQRRFWEHLIRDENDMKAHCDYIHYNPVKHGLAASPHDWPYSTFRRFVEQGIYASDWGTKREVEFDSIVGME